MDLVNQEKSALQREIERLTGLVLNQSTTATAQEDLRQRRSPASGDNDGDSTPPTASAESKANGMRSLFRLDLTKIGPSEHHDRIEFIHETPDKKCEKGPRADRRGISSNRKSETCLTEPKATRTSWPMVPFRYGAKQDSKKEEMPSDMNMSVSPQKAETSLYHKLRSKMSQSFTDVQERFGGRTNREQASVLNQTMPEQLVRPESPMKMLSLTSRRHFSSASKKKPLFVPGVSAVTEVGEEDDEEDQGAISRHDGCETESACYCPSKSVL